jgi:hypothetical protein
MSCSFKPMYVSETRCDRPSVRRSISPTVHKSEGPQVRKGNKLFFKSAHRSEGPHVRRSTSPKGRKYLHFYESRCCRANPCWWLKSEEKKQSEHPAWQTIKILISYFTSISISSVLSSQGQPVLNNFAEDWLCNSETRSTISIFSLPYSKNWSKCSVGDCTSSVN